MSDNLPMLSTLALAAIFLASDLERHEDAYGHVMRSDDICFKERSLWLREDAVLVGYTDLLPSTGDVLTVDAEGNLTTMMRQSDMEALGMLANLMSNRCDEDVSMMKIEKVKGQTLDQFISEVSERVAQERKWVNPLERQTPGLDISPLSQE